MRGSIVSSNLDDTVSALTLRCSPIFNRSQVALFGADRGLRNDGAAEGGTLLSPRTPKAVVVERGARVCVAAVGEAIALARARAAPP